MYKFSVGEFKIDLFREVAFLYRGAVKTGYTVITLTLKLFLLIHVTCHPCNQSIIVK